MTRMLRVPSSDGVQIAVHELGGTGDAPPGGGPGSPEDRETVVICHATGFCGRAYEQLAEELTGAFRVHALDFRGHGDSSVPENGNFDWGAMADDLLAAVDAVSGGRPIVGVGHSLGGAVLMLAETRRPGTLRAAHLFEPIVLPDELTSIEGADPLSERARRRRRTFPSKADALARYASRPPLNVLQAGSLAAYVEHGMETTTTGEVQLKCSPESEAATFEAGGKPTLDMIRSVSTPITVAVGTTERGWTPAMLGPLVADALPNGRLDRHPLLGHFGPLQGPATVGAMILEAVTLTGR